jgi:hypothetical protein
MSCKVACLFLSIMVLPSVVLATDLRGRVIRNDRYRGPIPVSGVKLTLQTMTGQIVGKAVISGTDGFFYFYNVNPNSYTLIYTYINTRAERKQGTLPLAVVNPQRQDIRQIVLTD